MKLSKFIFIFLILIKLKMKKDKNFYFIQSENQTFLNQIRKNIPTVTKNKSNNNNSILIFLIKLSS